MIRDRPIAVSERRRLHSGHFAFMRALIQGLDEQASWNRYLAIEGEHADPMMVRRTVAWVRDEFAAAAKRERRPGTGRLILLDASAHHEVAQPTLAEFAEARGMAEFSEVEQLEAYEEAFPVLRAPSRAESRRHARRDQIVERQLEALRWLQALVVQDPRPGDGAGAWFSPSIARRLEHAQLTTLEDIVDRINGVGARWWVAVPGVGELKARRIAEWLQATAHQTGLRIGAHAGRPRMQLDASSLATVQPAATALRPLEKLLLPAGRDGSDGRFRAPLSQCSLKARDDHAAVVEWIASHGGGNALSGATATQRAYRREAERLLLWAALVRAEPLSSLSQEDAPAYAAFLEAPPPAWCGPRHHQRWSPLWRPFESALTQSAVAQSFVVLRSLFRFLVTGGYLSGDFFTSARRSSQQRATLKPMRRLGISHWAKVDAMLEALPDTEPARRLRRGMRWMQATGLRPGELARLQCGSLRPPDGQPGAPEASHAAFRALDPEGRPIRRIAVPFDLVAELEHELARHMFEPDVQAIGNESVPVMARFGTGTSTPPAWSSSGLYQAIKAFLAHAAASLAEPDATRLRSASSQWLRSRDPDGCESDDTPAGGTGRRGGRRRADAQEFCSVAETATLTSQVRAATGAPGWPDARPSPVSRA